MQIILSIFYGKRRISLWLRTHGEHNPVYMQKYMLIVKHESLGVSRGKYSPTVAAMVCLYSALAQYGRPDHCHNATAPSPVSCRDQDDE